MTSRAKAIWDASQSLSSAHYAPSQTALILADFQNMIINMSPTGAATLPLAARLRSWAAAHNLCIIHSVIDTASQPAPTAKLAARWAGMADLLKDKPKLAGEHADLAPAEREAEGEVLDRRPPGVVSAVHSASVRRMLEERNVRSLIVCGISSTGVVLSTAREAGDLGFVVTVVEDACADRTDEAQRLAMDEVLPMTAHVATLDVVVAELGRAWGA
jgi:nicotinamidase-related amidase